MYVYFLFVFFKSSDKITVSSLEKETSVVINIIKWNEDQEIVKLSDFRKHKAD